MVIGVTVVQAVDDMPANNVVIAMFGYDERMRRLLHVLVAAREVKELVFEEGCFLCKGSIWGT